MDFTARVRVLRSDVRFKRLKRFLTLLPQHEEEVKTVDRQGSSQSVEGVMSTYTSAFSCIQVCLFPRRKRKPRSGSGVGVGDKYLSEYIENVI